MRNVTTSQRSVRMFFQLWIHVGYANKHSSSNSSIFFFNNKKTNAVLKKIQNDEFAGSPLLCQLTDGGSWSLVGVSNENRHCDRSFDDPQQNRVYLGVSSISDWVMQTVRR